MQKLIELREFSDKTERAIPYCLGDNVQGFRVVGTIPEIFDPRFEYMPGRAGGPGKTYTFNEGRNFEADHFFEGVLGATVARQTGLKVGDKFAPTHSFAEDGHVHEDSFTVVGILAPTGTPNDRAVFINMEGFYRLEGHAKEDAAIAAAKQAAADEAKEDAKEDHGHAHDAKGGAKGSEKDHGHSHDEKTPGKAPAKEAEPKAKGCDEPEPVDHDSPEGGSGDTSSCQATPKKAGPRRRRPRPQPRRPQPRRPRPQPRSRAWPRARRARVSAASRAATRSDRRAGPHQAPGLGRPGRYRTHQDHPEGARRPGARPCA